MALKQNVRIIETTRLQTSRIAVYLLIIHLLLFSLARMNCMQLHKNCIFKQSHIHTHARVNYNNWTHQLSGAVKRTTEIATSVKGI